MAHQIQAVTAYRPRIERGDPVQEERFMELITQRTTLSSGVVKNVQEAEVETLIGLLAEGRPVHTGVAVYTPTIDLDGQIKVGVKVDRRILGTLNASGKFRGRVLNAEQIGSSSADLVEMWNLMHPDDPVE